MSDETLGSGSPLADDRIQFFLKNRALIAEWASIADELAAETERELLALRPAIAAEIGAQHGREAHVTERRAGGSRGVLLHLPAWGTAGSDAPDVALGIGWEGSLVHPDPAWPGASVPYVGVVASRTTERGRRIEEDLRRAIPDGVPQGKPFRARPAATAPEYVHGIDWVAYRRVPADPSWYRDLVAWRMSVIAAVRGCWEDWAPRIDAAIAADPPG